ncbi:XRE family transcriptional regulator [Flavobacteriales bacterium]|nr:XRE family transcriptional regulator [Flavobacteriales bacterium]MDA9328912.1 XRE family transcriptional regulator [Flavobacteriales bacterium]
MSYFGTNLKILRKRRARSQADLSQSLKLTRSSLSAYEVGTAEPNYDTLMRISKYFKVPIDVFLKDDLHEFSELRLTNLENGFDVDVSGKKLRVLTTTVNQDNEENIELVPMAAQAGYTQGLYDPEYIKVLPTFQLPFLSKDRKYRTFPISGDSMPPISHGSFVTGEFIQNWNYVKDGYPYIIVTKEDGIVFKVVYNKIKSNKTFLLCSTNTAYEPYEVKVDDILEIWKFTNYINSDAPEFKLQD